MLLCVHVTKVLFLVLAGNSALTMVFYWSYTTRSYSSQPFLCALGVINAVRVTNVSSQKHITYISARPDQQPVKGLFTEACLLENFAVYLLLPLFPSFFPFLPSSLFPQQIKTVCEAVLKLINLGNSVSDVCVYIWQSCAEIKDYSVVYFGRIATFKPLYH